MIWLLWLSGGFIVIGGILTAAYRALPDVYGYESNKAGQKFELEDIPLFVLSIGVFSLALVLSVLFVSRFCVVDSCYEVVRGWPEKNLAAAGFGILLCAIAHRLVVKVGRGIIGERFIGTIIGIMVGVLADVIITSLLYGEFRPEGAAAIAMVLLIFLLAGGVIGFMTGPRMAKIFSPERFVNIGTEIMGGGIVGWLLIRKLPEYIERVELAVPPIIDSAGGLVIGVSCVTVVRVIAFLVSWLVLPHISRLLILLRFDTIICNTCLRYTQPLKSRYQNGGTRYCEHCQHEVEYTKDPGKVLLIFGDLRPEKEGRIFELSNLDFEQKDYAIEISEVYIDPQTCDHRLLERFITYIMNYRPTYGIGLVQIFYKGELDDLGGNLKNALQNTFRHIKQIS